LEMICIIIIIMILGQHMLIIQIIIK
jgi:hypothetical protein